MLFSLLQTGRITLLITASLKPRTEDRVISLNLIDTFVVPLGHIQPCGVAGNDTELAWMKRGPDILINRPSATRVKEKFDGV